MGRGLLTAKAVISDLHVSIDPDDSPTSSEERKPFSDLQNANTFPRGFKITRAPEGTQQEERDVKLGKRDPGETEDPQGSPPTQQAAELREALGPICEFIKEKQKWCRYSDW